MPVVWEGRFLRGVKRNKLSENKRHVVYLVRIHANYTDSKCWQDCSSNMLGDESAFTNGDEKSIFFS